MWNSVSQAFGYGWSVGLSLIRKMSNKIFDINKSGDEDISFVVQKIPQEMDLFENIISDQVSDHREQPKPDTDQASAEAIQMSVLYDSLDETSHRINAGNFGSPKRIPHRVFENHAKTPFPKSDNRTRQRVSSDVRWNHAGSGSNDCRWYNDSKLEKSLSDLSNSKWFSVTESNVKSPMHTLNSSESDLFPLRSRISSNPNEPSSHKPQPLYKSSSSSQLPCIRGNYKQWKCGSSSMTRPMPANLQQSYANNFLYLANHASYGKNVCACGESYGKKSNKTESILSLADAVETPEGLSWRRLHMSRAKLKATSTTSELLSGFAMVAMVELQINKPTAVPEWLFVLFAVCTTILVSVHIFALMISTYLLPNIDAVSKLHVSSLVSESPHDRMKMFIELAWAFSTILGLFLFLVEIAILCWVKFWDYSFTAAMSATMIIMPVLVLFVAFAMHFYHSLVVIKCKTSVSNMQELENMKRQLDNVSAV